MKSNIKIIKNKVVHQLQQQEGKSKTNQYHKNISLHKNNINLKNKHININNSNTYLCSKNSEFQLGKVKENCGLVKDLNKAKVKRKRPNKIIKTIKK